MIEPSLLADMLRMYPAQPATALWRAVEIDGILRLGLPEGRGLDLGCGDGKLTGVMLQRSGKRRLVGIDPDQLETEAAFRTGLYEAVHAVSADSIPEPDGSFDFVISNSVLEHIPVLEPVLTEVARLPRPGGVFLFTVPGPGFHQNLRGSLMPGVPRARYLAELDSRLAHCRYPTTAQWEALCGAAKLEMQGYVGYLNRRETRAWETLSRFTGGLLYALWGKQRQPIAIQRRLGLRQVQNRMQLPALLAGALGWAIRQVVRVGPHAWLAEDEAGCLLVHGIRP